MMSVALPRSDTRAARRVPGVSLERALSVVSPLALIALWEVAARPHLLDTRFFPAPSSILEAMGQMIQSGELWTDLSMSLRRIAIGFLIGVVPGVAIGIVMGLSPIVRAVIKPLVDATFPIPKVALVPLFILIFGIGDESKYASIAVAVIYLVLINTVAGARNIDRIYLDVGKNFGASRLMLFFDIALPAAADGHGWSEAGHGGRVHRHLHRRADRREKRPRLPDLVELSGLPD
jgi:ABC-type nitrate/sulfonate/bicarbonate transport system permease component